MSSTTPRGVIARLSGFHKRLLDWITTATLERRNLTCQFEKGWNPLTTYPLIIDLLGRVYKKKSMRSCDGADFRDCVDCILAPRILFLDFHLHLVSGWVHFRVILLFVFRGLKVLINIHSRIPWFYGALLDQTRIIDIERKIEHEIVEEVKRARTQKRVMRWIIRCWRAGRTRALQRERRGQTLNTYPSKHWAPLQHRARFTTPAAQVHLSQMVLSDFFWKKMWPVDCELKRCMSDDYESNETCCFFIFDDHKFNFIIKFLKDLNLWFK